MSEEVLGSNEGFEDVITDKNESNDSINSDDFKSAEALNNDEFRSMDILSNNTPTVIQIADIKNNNLNINNNINNNNNNNNNTNVNENNSNSNGDSNNNDGNDNNANENGNIPSIVVEGGKENDKNNNEKKDENIADNKEIKGSFQYLFSKNLSDSEDPTELKRTLSNLYDKVKLLSKDNINQIGDEENDIENNKDKEQEEIEKIENNDNNVKSDEDLNKYYRSFKGTFQKLKPMAIPSPELCATINNRYQNNFNIQEFFEHIEKITTENAGLLNNSLSSLANLVHAKSQDNLGKTDTIRSNRKNLTTGDAGLNKTYRSYFKFAKKKINPNNDVFTSNIPSNSIPIPDIEIPDIPPIEELPSRDPLSLGIYYHNRKQYDIADYYFTLSSVDNNAIGLYIHGMYLKYGHGISGCSPDLGFQYLLKSAESSIQSIPTTNKSNMRIASTMPKFSPTSVIDENVNKIFDVKEEVDTDGKKKLKEEELDEDQQDLLKPQIVPLNDMQDDESSNEMVADKMLMRTNITNILNKLTREEFETWIARCIVSLPIYEIGQSFLHGDGVQKSTSKAVYCFNVAAYMGDADAQMALAQCYKHGIGVKKTRKIAAMWYRKAHANGKCIFGESWVWKSKYDP